MDIQPSQKTPRSSAFVPGLLGLFLTMLAVGVSRAGTDGELLSRVFQIAGSAILGSIGLGALVLGARIALGRDEAAPSAPPDAVLLRCPACGSVNDASAASCAACLFAWPLTPTRGWSTSMMSAGMLLFLAGMGAGLALLGVGVGLGPLMESGPAPSVWVAIAMGALGLLVALVGGAFVWGACDGLRSRVSGVIEFTVASDTQTANVVAFARTHGSRLVSASGHSTRSADVPNEMARGLDAAQRAFVFGVAVLCQSKLLALDLRTRTTWTLDEGKPLEQKIAREFCATASPGELPPAFRPAYEAIAAHAGRETDVTVLWRTVRDNPALSESLVRWQGTLPPDIVAPLLRGEHPVARAVAQCIAASLAN